VTYLADQVQWRPSGYYWSAHPGQPSRLTNATSFCLRRPTCFYLQPMAPHQSNLYTSIRLVHKSIKKVHTSNDHAGILITFNRLPSRDKVTSSVKLAEWTKSNSDKHNVVLSSARYLTKMIWSDILSEFFLFFLSKPDCERDKRSEEDRRVAGRQYPRPWDMRWVYLSHSPH